MFNPGPFSIAMLVYRSVFQIQEIPGFLTLETFAYFLALPFRLFRCGQKNITSLPSEKV